MSEGNYSTNRCVIKKKIFISGWMEYFDKQWDTSLTFLWDYEIKGLIVVHQRSQLLKLNQKSIH